MSSEFDLFNPAFWFVSIKFLFLGDLTVTCIPLV